MNQTDTLVEDLEQIRSDAFVEVKYDEAIPNNVDLSSDKQLLDCVGEPTEGSAGRLAGVC